MMLQSVIIPFYVEIKKNQLALEHKSTPDLLVLLLLLHFLALVDSNGHKIPQQLPTA